MKFKFTDEGTKQWDAMGDDTVLSAKGSIFHRHKWEKATSEFFGNRYHFRECVCGKWQLLHAGHLGDGKWHNGVDGLSPSEAKIVQRIRQVVAPTRCVNCGDPNVTHWVSHPDSGGAQCCRECAEIAVNTGGHVWKIEPANPEAVVRRGAASPPAGC